MTGKQLAKKEPDAVETVVTPEVEAVYVPDVDIRESADCVRLVANMPGVDQKSVEVTVENNVLTVEGRASIEPPRGYEPLDREYAVGKFRRDFTLSDAVNTEGIKARVRHGVLEVSLPKREEVKTRKIEIGG
jgi:HSP20 family molecular chaperone IbpA